VLIPAPVNTTKVGGLEHRFGQFFYTFIKITLFHGHPSV
jgi:hypothetical protein